MSQSAKFVTWEVAMKERKVFKTSKTDNHVSAWGAWPAYQQDISEPQNEGGRRSGMCWGARGCDWNNH